MIQNIKLFFARLRQLLFERRLNTEIFKRIFPHINQEQGCGYAFMSKLDFQKTLLREGQRTHEALDELERTTEAMPEAYGQALRFIFYRDLQARLAMYQRLAKREVQPKHYDLRSIATRAP